MHTTKKTALILLFILIAFLAERFVFTTIEYVTYTEPEFLSASVNSELTISVTAHNRLGFRNILDGTDIDFIIEHGSNLVEVFCDKNSNRIKLLSKGVEGEVLIGIYIANSGIYLKTVVVRILPSGFVYFFPCSLRALLV